MIGKIRFFSGMLEKKKIIVIAVVFFITCLFLVGLFFVFEKNKKNEKKFNLSGSLSLLSNGYVTFQEGIDGVSYVRKTVNSYRQSLDDFSDFQIVPLLSQDHLDDYRISDIETKYNFYHSIEFVRGANKLTEDTLLNLDKNLLAKRFELKNISTEEFGLRIKFNINDKGMPGSITERDNAIIVGEEGNFFGFSIKDASFSYRKNENEKTIEIYNVKQKSKNTIYFLVSQGNDMGQVLKNFESVGAFEEEYGKVVVFYDENYLRRQKKTAINKSLDEWVAYLSAQLLAHQVGETGAIVLGLPNRDVNNYAVYPKEMCIYMYALLRAGFYKEVEDGLRFLARTQRKEGYWDVLLSPAGKSIIAAEDEWRGEHETAAILPPIVVHELWKRTNNNDILKEFDSLLVNLFNYNVKQIDEKSGLVISRINDNDPYSVSEIMDKETDVYVLHFYNSLSMAKTMGAYAEMFAVSGYGDLSLKASSLQEKIKKNIMVLQDKDSGVFRHMLMDGNWNIFKEINDLKSDDKDRLGVVDGKLYFSSDNVTRGNFRTKFNKNLDFTLKFSKVPSRGQYAKIGIGLDNYSKLLAFSIYDGIFRVETVNSNGEKSIKNVEGVNLSKENKYEIAQTDGQIRFFINSREVHSVNYKESSLPLLIDTRNANNLTLMISEMSGNNLSGRERWWPGISTRFMEPALWADDFGEIEQIESTIGYIDNNLQIVPGAFNMGEKAWLEDHIAQQSGQLISALVRTKKYNKALDYINFNKDYSNAFGALAEYTSKDLDFSKSSSVNDAWTISNIIIAYYNLAEALKL